MDAKIAELNAAVSAAGVEIASLNGGRKASAARARASLQKVKTVAQSLRQDIMLHVKAMPVKAKTKAPPPPKLERQNAIEPEAAPVAPISVVKPVKPKKK